MNNTKPDGETAALIHQLRVIIECECSKPYMEMDADLISECVDWLFELEGLRKLTQEEIDEGIRIILSNYDSSK